MSDKKRKRSADIVDVDVKEDALLVHLVPELVEVILAYLARAPVKWEADERTAPSVAFSNLGRTARLVCDTPAVEDLRYRRVVRVYADQPLAFTSLSWTVVLDTSLNLKCNIFPHTEGRSSLGLYNESTQETFSIGDGVMRQFDRENYGQCVDLPREYEPKKVTFHANLETNQLTVIFDDHLVLNHIDWYGLSVTHLPDLAHFTPFVALSKQHDQVSLLE